MSKKKKSSFQTLDFAVGVSNSIIPSAPVYMQATESDKFAADTSSSQGGWGSGRGGGRRDYSSRRDGGGYSAGGRGGGGRDEWRGDRNDRSDRSDGGNFRSSNNLMNSSSNNNNNESSESSRADTNRQWRNSSVTLNSRASRGGSEMPWNRSNRSSSDRMGSDRGMDRDRNSGNNINLSRGNWGNRSTSSSMNSGSKFGSGGGSFGSSRSGGMGGMRGASSSNNRQFGGLPAPPAGPVNVKSKFAMNKSKGFGAKFAKEATDKNDAGSGNYLRTTYATNSKKPGSFANRAAATQSQQNSQKPSPASKINTINTKNNDSNSRFGRNDAKQSNAKSSDLKENNKAKDNVPESSNNNVKQNDLAKNGKGAKSPNNAANGKNVNKNVKNNNNAQNGNVANKQKNNAKNAKNAKNANNNNNNNNQKKGTNENKGKKKGKKGGEEEKSSSAKPAVPKMSKEEMEKIEKENQKKFSKRFNNWFSSDKTPIITEKNFNPVKYGLRQRNVVKDIGGERLANFLVDTILDQTGVNLGDMFDVLFAPEVLRNYDSENKCVEFANVFLEIMSLIETKESCFLLLKLMKQFDVTSNHLLQFKSIWEPDVMSECKEYGLEYAYPIKEEEFKKMESIIENECNIDNFLEYFTTLNEDEGIHCNFNILKSVFSAIMKKHYFELLDSENDNSSELLIKLFGKSSLKSDFSKLAFYRLMRILLNMPLDNNDSMESDNSNGQLLVSTIVSLSFNHSGDKHVGLLPLLKEFYNKGFILYAHIQKWQNDLNDDETQGKRESFIHLADWIADLDKMAADRDDESGEEEDDDEDEFDNEYAGNLLAQRKHKSAKDYETISYV